MAAPKSFLLTPELSEYLVGHTRPVDAVQEWLIGETAALGPIAGMQVAPEQGAFLTIFAAAVGARSAIEVGTFTGYSSLCLARGLGPEGRLICCDVSEEWTALAREAWTRAGVADRVDLRIAPATDTIAALPEDSQFDLAFIDADKPGYWGYFDALVPRMRPGACILVDNVLWSGRVIDAAATDDDTRAIRDFNDRVATDPRVEVVMLPVADGLTIARVLP